MAETGDATVSSGKPWSGGGREELAVAVRRLTTAGVTSAASPEMLEDAATQANALAEGLERYVPSPGAAPSTRFADAQVASGQASTMAGALPFHMIFGACTHAAPP